MATGQWTVYVPDRTAPYNFPDSLTAEEVRAVVVSTGHPNVQTAEMILNGNTITFRRPVGGTKGR